MKNRKTIKFGSNEFEFFFGLSFLGEFLEEQKISLNDIDEKLNTNPFKFLPTLMYASYKHNLERNGKNVKLKYYNFVDVLEENGGFNSEQIQEFMQAFTKSLTSGVEQENNNDSSKKK